MYGEVCFQKGFLDLCVEGYRRRFGKHLLVDPEMDGGLVVSGRHEDAPSRIDAHAKDGRRIKVGEEDQRIVGFVLAAEKIEELRAPRPLLPEPRPLIVFRMRMVKDPVGKPVEGVDVARLGILESPHHDAVDAIGAFRDTRSPIGCSRERTS